MKTLILTLVLLVGTVSAAYATDCTYDGNTYQPGTTIGTLICQPDGTWKPNDR